MVLTQRKTKFRGKTVNGEWVFGNLNVVSKERPDGIAPGHYISNLDGRFPFAYAVRPETIGQFTCHEYKGNELYEGDIVEWKLDDTYATIVWANGSFYIENAAGNGYNLPYHARYITNIVGNRFDNKELLQHDEEAS
jgi:hypothetical protein